MTLLITIANYRVSQLQYDPEIEKTAKRLRKETKLRKNQALSSTSLQSNTTTESTASCCNPEVEQAMAEEQRTLRELSAPNVNQQPLCIQHPALEVGFELRSASRAASIRREICGIKQRDVETLHEYWERFKQLCASCPQHGVSEQLLIQYFYEGLLPMERNMMDAASGGAIVNKTPREARDLISIMAANSQQFGCRQDASPRRVNEVNISSIENKLSHLTTLVQQLAVGNMQQVKACGICAATGHQTDMCPTLQYDSCEQANAIGGFLGQPQRNYDPYSNTYNPGWRDHPNFSYKPRPQFPQFHPRQPIQQPSSSQQSSSNSGMSLEDIVKTLATNTQQFQQETRTSIQHLESQVSQLASTVSRLESQGKLPSQTVVNPKQNASAVTLRSGKELQEPTQVKSRHNRDEEKEKEVHPPQNDQKLVKEHPEAVVIPPPFPSRLEKSKKDEEQKEILDTFRKVEVNIPLLELLNKFLDMLNFLKSCAQIKEN
ncbi:PREDICTED: uncharacterized protein LOC109193754 [Ipomoea nil]|uniref:uncharacterized protein LOC109193754 n=1 Tax=Ipomoea nil TaxID=35883 RepID=UPI000900F21C|nr:PREDICTED: uncharacterized protein LOC109193754 [Ipomoea nil]